MLTMHRWFDISAAVNDLGFEPIVDYAEGMADTCAPDARRIIAECMRNERRIALRSSDE